VKWTRFRPPLKGWISALLPLWNRQNPYLRQGNLVGSPKGRCSRRIHQRTSVSREADWSPRCQRLGPREFRRRTSLLR